jgi:hypothetical protein
MGERPKFRPVTKVKLVYDSENLYVIFHVQDNFVRCLKTEINSHVCEDACVEFFFTPDVNFPKRYFNIEINCNGTILMRYNSFPEKNFKYIDVEDIKQIGIAHSLQGIIENELSEPIEWTVECKIPISILEKYATVTNPRPGVKWLANFYKIATKTSNPHYITWSLVKSVKPDFHLPEFFGVIQFK